jgi:hypothetical protein
MQTTDPKVTADPAVATISGSEAEAQTTRSDDFAAAFLGSIINVIDLEERKSIVNGIRLTFFLKSSSSTIRIFIVAT